MTLSLASCYSSAFTPTRIITVLFLLSIAFVSIGTAEDDSQEKLCNKGNGTKCETCLNIHNGTGLLGCYWCMNDKTCHHSHFAKARHCGWTNEKYLNCWFNLEALVICCSILGALLLISLCACYCWCKGKCKARTRRRMEKREQEYERREDERKARNEEKNQERAAKRDAIREKYGLKRNEDGSYRRMEEESED